MQRLLLQRKCREKLNKRYNKILFFTHIFSLLCFTRKYNEKRQLNTRNDCTQTIWHLNEGIIEDKPVEEPHDGYEKRGQNQHEGQLFCTFSLHHFCHWCQGSSTKYQRRNTCQQSDETHRIFAGSAQQKHWN